MGVDLRRDLDRRVPDELRDDRHVRAGVHQERDVGVSEVVDANVWDAGLPLDPVLDRGGRRVGYRPLPADEEELLPGKPGRIQEIGDVLPHHRGELIQYRDVPDGRLCDEV